MTDEYRDLTTDERKEMECINAEMHAEFDELFARRRANFERLRASPKFREIMKRYDPK